MLTDAGQRLLESLKLSPDLVLDREYVTKVVAILAQRRKGKTYTASVLAEELWTQGLPWVAIDPTGAWWGLRASADGRSEGLPVIVLGGKHGDAPLPSHMGRVVADLVLDHPGWYVLDFSDFDTRAEERRFATDFADRLYRRKGQKDMDYPMHLFVDEADLFVPQERETGDMKMLGAFQAIVRRGGLRGLGVTLISQRPALVNKSVLTQLDVLILLRLVAGQDQDAVRDSYLKRAGTKEQRDEVMGSMASLSIGEAWVWEPGGEPAIYQRVQVRERNTFNSSATPKVGEARIEPERLAQVDLTALREALDEEIERHERDDPAKLHAEIARLKADLDKLEHERAEERAHPLVSVQPVIPAWLVPKLRGNLDTIEAAYQAMAGVVGSLASVNLEVEPGWVTAPETEGGYTITPLGDVGTNGGTIEGTELAPKSRSSQVSDPQPVDNPVDMPEATRTEPDESLGTTDRKVLTALAQRGGHVGSTYSQVAILAGLKPSSQHIRNLISSLRSRGYVGPGQPLKITADGIIALGEFERLPKPGPDLIHWWIANKLNGTQAKVFRAYVDHYPEGMDATVAAERTGLDPASQHIRNVISSLRSLDLLVGTGSGTKINPDLLA